jgi:hypothetical protein
MTTLKYQENIPFSFRCRCWLRSIADPRTSTDAYRLSHCFPSIARKAENRVAAMLEYRILWTWTIALGGPVHCGNGGISLEVGSLTVCMSILRSSVVSSPRSGWSWGWMSMMNAEVTAENRPAYQSINKPRSLCSGRRLTKIKVVFRSSSYFFMNSLSKSSASLWYFS